jgi:hypothetical protein
MSTAELDASLIFNDTEPESAPLPGADFSYPDNVIEFPRQKPPPEILDVLLANNEGPEPEPDADSVAGLKDYMQALLEGQRNRYRRGGIAADYAAGFHDELDIDEAGLGGQQRTALMLARLYLSNVGSLGKLDQFIMTNRRNGRKSASAVDAKVEYLAARKVLQDDIDRYFERFEGECEELKLLETLMDVGNMARLTLSERPWINAEGDTYTHIFVGSILSERLVKVSLAENVHPEARYGTEEEDKSPTKADVVFPIQGGDMYVQVKMKWKKKIDLKVQPKKKPPHVVVPMQSIRARLSDEEHARIAEIISAAAERKSRAMELEKACAVSGLGKYLAIGRIPLKHYRDWWQEFKDVIQAEKQQYSPALQTGVDKVE